MPRPSLTPEQQSQLETLVKLFIDRVQGLETKFGHDSVLDALKKYKLFHALTSLQELTKDSLVFLLTQIHLQKSNKQSLEEQLLKEVGYVGAALSAMGLTAASKELDQDVDIASISTDQELPVTSPPLEAILGSTHQTIQSLTDMLASALKEIDNSIDFLAATETGGSLASVQGAQAQSVAQSREPVEMKQSNRDSKEQK
jgi:hypothetical protein